MSQGEPNSNLLPFRARETKLIAKIFSVGKKADSYSQNSPHPQIICWGVKVYHWDYILPTAQNSSLRRTTEGILPAHRNLQSLRLVSSGTLHCCSLEPQRLSITLRIHHRQKHSTRHKTVLAGATARPARSAMLLLWVTGNPSQA